MVPKLNAALKVHQNAPNKNNNNNNINNNTQLELSALQNKLENFEKHILKDVEKRMDCMIDELMQEMRQQQLQRQEFRNFAHDQSISQTNNNDTNNNNTSDEQQQYYDPVCTWNNRIVVHKAESAAKTKTKTGSGTTETASSENAVHLTEDPTTSILENDKTDNTKSNIRKGLVTTSSDEKNIKTKKYRRFPEKIFTARESYLTALLEVDHMRAIYHIFYNIFIFLALNTITYDYFVEGSMNFGLGTFKIGFAKLHYVLGILVLKNLFVLSIYYALQIWAFVRAKLRKQASLRKFWSHCCLITYLASQILFAYVAAAIALQLNLPFVTASILLVECIRLLMKMHAFVRSMVPRIQAGKMKADAETDEIDGESILKSSFPPFSCYAYFVFAPTLLYRDHYPRTAQIRWKFALARFMEVVAIAFIYSNIYERYLYPYFGQFGIEELNASAWIVKLFGMFMPGIIVFLCGFYLILHAWLNFTAELLRFGDRMFYKNWWTASTYDAYYRNWNVVVHDWLYEYVYKDCCNYLFGGSKVAASLMVFAVSALAHEFILGFGLQLFFPVLLFFFGGVGVACHFLTQKAPKHLGNLFLWFSLICGFGITISCYCMEYFARHNCPKEYNNWIDYLTPAILNCYKN